jgi:hypothetical protein
VSKPLSHHLPLRAVLIAQDPDGMPDTWAVLDNDNDVVVTTWDSFEGRTGCEYVNPEPICDRISTCVNACASIPNPQAIPDAIEALKPFNRAYLHKDVDRPGTDEVACYFTVGDLRKVHKALKALGVEV